jgi:hypothetical protein
VCPAIENAASCQIFAVIRFLHSKIMSAAELHSELCAAVCGQNVMSEGIVRQWCRMFRDDRKSIHDEERSGRPDICSERRIIFFELLTKKFVKDCTSQF